MYYITPQYTSYTLKTHANFQTHPTTHSRDSKASLTIQMLTVLVCRAGGIAHARILQKVVVRVIPLAQCEQWYNEQFSPMPLYKSHLCAGYKAGGKDACQVSTRLRNFSFF